MSEISCEGIRVAAMAIADGEESSLSTGEIESHLLHCGACREEMEQLQATNKLFRMQQRLQPPANLWPRIDERIQGSERPFPWRLLLLFGVPLFGYKLFLLLIQATPNIWFKLFPLVFVVAIFAYLKTNPFKINSELTFKGELTS